MPSRAFRGWRGVVSARPQSFQGQAGRLVRADAAGGLQVVAVLGPHFSGPGALQNYGESAPLGSVQGTARPGGRHVCLQPGRCTEGFQPAAETCSEIEKIPFKILSLIDSASDRTRVVTESDHEITVSHVC